jgi:hypothetical protein
MSLSAMVSRSAMAASPNARLRKRRMENDWGRRDVVARLEMLADELGDAAPQVDENLVGKWERGDRTPGPFYAPRLCLIFDLPPQEIGLRATPRLLVELRRLTQRLMKRRQFLARSIMVGGALMSEPILSLSVLRNVLPRRTASRSPFTSGVNLDDALLDDVNRRVILCMERWDQLPPQTLLPVVSSYVDELQTALHLGLPAPLAGRIEVIGSEAAAFAGLLGWFMQQRSVAEAYLTLADELAERAGHAPTRGIVMAIRADFHSRVQLGRREGSAVSRSLLDEAESLLGPAPSVFRAWVLQRQAEEYAAIGDERSCQRYLDVADTTFSLLDSPPPGMFAHWSWDMHAAFRGNCEQLLGQYRNSAETLTRVLARLHPDASSNRAALQADIAAAVAQHGDLDQACDLLMQSLTLAGRAGLRERVKRIAGIRTSHLGLAAGEPMVRELDEQLRTVNGRWSEQ